jgi:RHS repeat-associated protein
VRALTDGSGTITDTYTYDAYGKTLTSTGLVPNPFGYAGGYTDTGTGFIYLLYRYYDPESQQFLTVDPALAWTQEAYVYSGGSPTNLRDPWGLDANCGLVPNPWDPNSCISEGFSTPAGKVVVALGAVAAGGVIVACFGSGVCEIAGAAAAGSSTSPWLLKPFQRGVVIENMLGRSTFLAQNFPVIDRWVNGAATSIKSLDLNAPTYQNLSALASRVQGYCNTMSNYSGQINRWGGIQILPQQITGRAVELAIPTGATAAQMSVLAQTQSYALGLPNPVILIIKVIP